MGNPTPFVVAFDFKTHLPDNFELVKAGDTLTLDLTGSPLVTYTPGAAHANGSASLFPEGALGATVPNSFSNSSDSSFFSNFFCSALISFFV